MPQTAQVIFWCDRQNKTTPLTDRDPDLLWYTMEAQFHVYLTRCYTGGKGKYLVSIDNCTDPGKPPPRNQYESDDEYDLRLKNRSIICQSSPIVHNLYLAPGYD